LNLAEHDRLFRIHWQAAVAEPLLLSAVAGLQAEQP
jgi:hypothetical protein